MKNDIERYSTQKIWCLLPDSNWYAFWAADFKSAVSTDSTKQAPDFFLANNGPLRKAKSTTS